MSKSIRIVLMCMVLSFGAILQFSVLSFFAPETAEAAKKKKKKRKNAKRSADDYTHQEIMQLCKKMYTEAAAYRVAKRNGKWTCYTYE